MNCNKKHSNKLPEADAKLLTKAESRQLQKGKVVYARDACGCLLRCKVNGRVKTWKRYPKIYDIPMKYGLSSCFHATEQDDLFVRKETL